MTLKIPDELRAEVAKALANHAAYLSGYKDEPRIAEALLKLADELRKDK